MAYNLQQIRTLLTEGFDIDELRRFCYDHPGFRDVYYQLSPEMGKDKVIDRLIEHAGSNAHVETGNGQVALNSLCVSPNFHDISSLVRGIDQYKLTIANLDKIPVQVPPLPLQQKFARIVQKYERLRGHQRRSKRRGRICSSRCCIGCLGGNYKWQMFVAPSTSGTSARGRITMPINRRLSGCCGICRRRGKFYAWPRS